MGTPAAAVPTLRRCVGMLTRSWLSGLNLTDLLVAGIKSRFRPVKEFALSKGLTVYQPTKLKTDESRKLFSSHDADVVVVVAYGRILPVEFLDAPRNGCINVHFSLLHAIEVRHR
jgi:methionyl-tRNA formyltransferase